MAEAMTSRYSQPVAAMLDLRMQLIAEREVLITEKRRKMAQYDAKIAAVETTIELYKTSLVSKP